MHSAKITYFVAINHDDNHKFSLKFARATECRYTSERIFFHTFMGVCVCIKIESYIHKIHNIHKIPKSSGWCLVSNFDLQEFQNSFHDLQIELLECHLYNNYSLTSDLLFISIRFYIDIRILIDSATVAITIFNDPTTAWLTNRFFNYYLKRENFL